MENIFRLYWNLCRFKQGPQDVPVSTFLLTLLLVSNLFLEIMLGMTVYTFANAFFISLVSLISLLVMSYLFLLIFQLQNRFLQTITALVGVNLLTNLAFFIPMTLLWKVNIINDISFGFLNLILLAWILAIYAHIFRHALSISLFLGFALSVGYFITFSSLSNYFIGV